MKKTGSITSLAAITKLGIMSLPKRICELKREGFKIKREWRNVYNRWGDTVRVAVYSLEKKR